MFQANDTPIASDDHGAMLDRKILNNAEQKLWDEHLFPDEQDNANNR